LRALITRAEAVGTTSTLACRFWIVSWTVIRKLFQTLVALNLSLLECTEPFRDGRVIATGSGSHGHRRERRTRRETQVLFFFFLGVVKFTRLFTSLALWETAQIGSIQFPIFSRLQRSPTKATHAAPPPPRRQVPPSSLFSTLSIEVVNGGGRVW
jgi:hypothetical protein